MPNNILVLCGILLYSAALQPRGAFADLKVVQTTTMANAQYAAMRDSMTPQQKAAAHHDGMDLMMGIPQSNTIYASGRFLRVDTSTSFVLFDNVSGALTKVNPSARSYSTVTTDGQSDRFGGFQVSYMSGKKHRVILGQPATEYTLTGTSISFPGQVVSGTVWTADSIARPSLPPSGMFSRMTAFLKQLKGLPLVVNVKITGTQVGEIDISSKVVSLSRASLPSRVFQVPTGYKQTDPYAGPMNPMAAMGGGF